MKRSCGSSTVSDSEPHTDVEWTRQAWRDLRKLTPSAADRVRRAVQRFADGESADCHRLRGLDRPRHRLRVGAWRVFLRWDDNVCHILRVRHRREAYRKLGRIRQAAPEAADPHPDEEPERSASVGAPERTEG